jgi:hypothetical protein
MKFGARLKTKIIFLISEEGGREDGDKELRPIKKKNAWPSNI